MSPVEVLEMEVDKLIEEIKQAESKNETLLQQREAFCKAINKIDDYFEYSNESKQDKEFVYGVIDNLSMKLALIK